MDARALLTLQIEWGADEALDDAPVDRLRPAAPPRPAPSPAIPLPSRAQLQDQPHPPYGASHPPHAAPPPPYGASPPPHAAPPPPYGASPPPHAAPPPPYGASPPPHAAPPPLTQAGTAAERAIAAAGAASSIDALRAAIAAFDGCALRDTATKPVLPQGDPAAGLLLIGDPPGADEDRSGTPFAGEDGALLDRMLASIGLARAGLLLAPLIPWRPPGGRQPSPGELAVCLPFLHRLLVLADPGHILLLGPLAARMLLDGKRRRPGAGWAELSVPGRSAPLPALVLASPHMVRTTPSVRRDAWTELRRLRRVLDNKIAES